MTINIVENSVELPNHLTFEHLKDGDVFQWRFIKGHNLDSSWCEDAFIMLDKKKGKAWSLSEGMDARFSSDNSVAFRRFDSITLTDVIETIK